MKQQLQRITEAAIGFCSRSIDKGKGAFVFALLFMAGLMGNVQAEPSAYVSLIEDASDQLVEDVTATVPLGLMVAVVTAGIFIAWRIWKKLARA